MRLYGIAEIAQELGMKPGTISQWHHRGKLPEPYAHLAIGPVWAGKSFESWLRSQRK